MVTGDADREGVEPRKIQMGVPMGLSLQQATTHWALTCGSGKRA